MNIIFYDGACGVCTSIVASIAKHDKNKLFYYAPLKGETAKSMLTREEREGDSVILLQGKQKYLRSDAFFTIMEILGHPIKHLSMFPKPVADLCYRIIARYRKYIPIKKANLPKDRCLP